MKSTHKGLWAPFFALLFASTFHSAAQNNPSYTPYASAYFIEVSNGSYEIPNIGGQWVGGTHGYVPDPSPSTPQFVYEYITPGTAEISGTAFLVSNQDYKLNYYYSGAGTPIGNLLVGFKITPKVPTSGGNLNIAIKETSRPSSAFPSGILTVNNIQIIPINLSWKSTATDLDTLNSKDTLIDVHQYTKNDLYYSIMLDGMMDNNPVDPANNKVNMTLTGSGTIGNRYFNPSQAYFGTNNLAISGTFLNGAKTISRNVFVDMVGNDYSTNAGALALNDTFEFTNLVQCAPTDQIQWSYQEASSLFGSVFKSGTVGTANSAKISFSVPGHWTIKMKITNSKGSKTVTKTVMSVPFGFYNTSGIQNFCGTGIINLKNYVIPDGSTGLTSYKFFIDDILIPNGQLNTDTLGYGSHSFKIQHATQPLTKTIAIFNNRPEGEFAVSPATVTVDDNITAAAGAVTGASTYNWEFETGQTDSGMSASYAYNTPGLKTITLTASEDSCSRIITKQINVINFGFQTTGSLVNLCTTGNEVDLRPYIRDYTADIAIYLDNIALAGYMLNMSTLTFGNHTLKITKTISGTLLSKELNFTNNTPSGFIDLLSNPVVTDAPIQFTSSNITGVSSYLWNFPDGSTNNIAAPTFIFETPGLQSVTLTGTSGSGCSKTFTKDINVINFGFQNTTNLINLCTTNPNVDLVPYIRDYSSVINIYLDNVALTGAMLDMNTLTYGSHILKITKTISGSLHSKELTFTNNTPSGYVDVSTNLIVTDDPVQFTSTNILGASSYLWHFPDGSTNTIAAPTFIFGTPGSFVVTLDAQSNTSCSKSFTKTVNVINFGFQNTAALVNLCTPNATVDLIPYIRDYSSAITLFLDNVAMSGSTLDMTTLAYGNHTIKITKTVSGTLLTKELAFTNNTPSGYISQSSNIVVVEEPVQFNASTISGTTSLLWDFGGGITNTTAMPTVTFDTPGMKTILLTAASATGCSKTFTKNIDVINFGFQSTSSLITLCTTDPTVDLIPFIRDYSSAIIIYLDNVLMAGTNLNMNTLAYGSHTLKITKSIGGNVLNKEMTFFNNVPSGMFTASSNLIITDDSVTFNAASIAGGSSYHWDFGNGLTDNGSSVKIACNEEGTYPITLTTTSASGCQKILTKDIIVHPFGFKNTKEILSLCNLDSILYLDKYIRALSDTVNVFLDNEPLLNGALDLNELSYGQHELKIEKVIEGTSFSKALDFESDRPSGNITTDQNDITEGDTVVFTAAIEGAEKYFWQFPQNIRSQSLSTSYTFGQPGAQEVIFTATSASGCERTYRTMIEVSASDKPKITADIYDVLPNPMTDQVTLVMDFGDNAEILVQFISTANQLMYQQTYRGSGKLSETISVAHFASGQYYMARFIKDGKLVKTINLQKL